MTDIRTVGVVGAGQMGNGIAHVCALAGYDVLLSDADTARIDAAIEIIRGNLNRQVHRNTITQADQVAALDVVADDNGAPPGPRGARHPAHRAHPHARRPAEPAAAARVAHRPQPKRS